MCMERRLRRTFRVRASCTWRDRTSPIAQPTQQIRSAKVVGLRARNLVRAVHRQHSWDKLGRLKKGVFLAHRSVHRSEDETAFQFGEGYGREGRQGHPPGDTQAVFGGGKDPDRFGRPARRGQHRRAVPPRGYRAEPVLSLVEGLPGGWQEAPGRGHGSCRNFGRGQGSAARGNRAQGGCRRSDPGKPSAQKKRDGGWGGRGMRYSASEKLEIIRLVEQSHLPVRRTLGQIGIPRSTFYRWYDQYQTGGPEALDDRSPRPDRVWNRIPDDVRSRVVTLALDEPELSPRELAVRFTDAERYFVSEASVYRLLKAHDLLSSCAFIVIKAADEFKDKTTAPNQLWQTDFTYLK